MDLVVTLIIQQIWGVAGCSFRNPQTSQDDFNENHQPTDGDNYIFTDTNDCLNLNDKLTVVTSS